MVLPGDYVAESEEYLPGFGVYSEKGKLFSSNIGELELDPKTHTAKVKVSTRIPKMQDVGIITLGVIADVTENTALVDLIPFESKNFVFVPNGVSAIIHVSKVKRGYTENMREEFRVGDIVRAKIIEVSRHTVSLTTSDKNLGVIQAFCSKCRSELVKKGTSLVCSKCGYMENRKFAYDYGTGNIL